MAYTAVAVVQTSVGVGAIHFSGGVRTAFQAGGLPSQPQPIFTQVIMSQLTESPYQGEVDTTLLETAMAEHAAHPAAAQQPAEPEPRRKRINYRSRRRYAKKVSKQRMAEEQERIAEELMRTSMYVDWWYVNNDTRALHCPCCGVSMWTDVRSHANAQSSHQ